MTNESNGTKIGILEMLPERVRGIDLYDPLRVPITYDLSDNTSQWGMAPGVKERLSTLINDPSIHLSRYPDIYGSSLKLVLANQYESYLSKSPEENIVIGCGTDDVLDCIIRACTNEGDTIINPMPSFPMAGYFAKYNGREVIGIELNEDGSLDVDKFLGISSKLIYLCSPNNPTGLPIDRRSMEDLIFRFKGFIVIDEAYAEFAENNFLDLLKDNPRVLILRTFSKLHALAGLRIGYGLGNVDVISAVEAVRGPYKANTIALAAAHDSLSQKTWLRTVVDQTRETREWFLRELFEIGLAPLPSEANFILIPMKISRELRSDFERSEIAVRIFEELPIYGSAIRITIASKEILQKVLDILRQEK